MKKGIIATLMATVLMTACGDMPYIDASAQGTVLEPEFIPEAKADVLRIADAETKDIEAEDTLDSETSQDPEEGQESAAGQDPEEGQAAEEGQTPAGLESTAEPHVCRRDSSSTVIVPAFGEHEPDCFYGAKYDVKCADCGKYLDVMYRGPLGHAGNEGVVTCQPDCTGGGSIKYTCVRCGAEWSEAYGQVQPHTWVEGSRKETDWINGGTKEVPYLYCGICGEREESE